jgi:hypothetical protein
MLLILNNRSQELIRYSISFNFCRIQCVLQCLSRHLLMSCANIWIFMFLNGVYFMWILIIVFISCIFALYFWYSIYVYECSDPREDCPIRWGPWGFRNRPACCLWQYYASMPPLSRPEWVHMCPSIFIDDFHA